MPSVLSWTLIFVLIASDINSSYGDCTFPSEYEAYTLFNFYTNVPPTATSKWNYMTLGSKEIITSRNDDVALMKIKYKCESSLTKDGFVYFIYSQAMLNQRLCAKLKKGDFGEAFVFSEVETTASDVSECPGLFTEECYNGGTQKKCSSLWRPQSPKTMPAEFKEVTCPFIGSYQLSVQYMQQECWMSLDSTADIADSQMSLKACDGSAKSSLFKQRNILSETLTCLGDVELGPLSADTGAPTVHALLLLSSDHLTLFCAKYIMESEGVYKMSIDISTISYASCNTPAVTSAEENKYLALTFMKPTLISTTPGLPLISPTNEKASSSEQTTPKVQSTPQPVVSQTSTPVADAATSTRFTTIAQPTTTLPQTTAPITTTQAATTRPTTTTQAPTTRPTTTTQAPTTRPTTTTQAPTTRPTTTQAPTTQPTTTAQPSPTTSPTTTKAAATSKPSTTQQPQPRTTTKTATTTKAATTLPDTTTLRTTTTVRFTASVTTSHNMGEGNENASDQTRRRSENLVNPCAALLCPTPMTCRIDLEGNAACACAPGMSMTGEEGNMTCLAMNDSRTSSSILWALLGASLAAAIIAGLILCCTTNPINSKGLTYITSPEQLQQTNAQSFVKVSSNERDVYLNGEKVSDQSAGPQTLTHGAAPNSDSILPPPPPVNNSAFVMVTSTIPPN